MRTISVLILDSSTSMESLGKEVLDGINTSIRDIRKFARGEDRTFFFQFASTVKPVLINVPSLDLKELESFVPNGMTAMYDGIGKALEAVDAHVTDTTNTRYRVEIISDGAENSSSEFSGKQVADMIAARKNSERWTFTYSGTNQDLEAVAKNLNIDRGNIMSYDNHSRGFAKGTSLRSAAATAYYTNDAVMSTSASFSEDGTIADASGDQYTVDMSKIDHTEAQKRMKDLTKKFKVENRV